MAEKKGTGFDVKKLVDISVTKFKKDHWMLASIVLAALLIIFLFANGGMPGYVTKTKAGEVMVDFLNEKTGGGVTLVDVELDGDFYKVTVSYQGSNIPVYMTRDGNQFTQAVEAITLTGGAVDDTPVDTGVVKSDKPVVELFVMTHCPYGTQAEKGFLPAIAELGNSVDASIKFVHYFLHAPEETETPIQICIREEQNDKFAKYLTCFLEDGDSDRCLVKTGIDESALNDCIENDYEDYYAADSKLSEGYGVRGSPTLVINGAQVSTGRSEAAMLATICSAFNDAPEACNSELNTASPTPGFGWETGSNSASAATASC